MYDKTPPGEQPFISLRSVTKSFGPSKAVDDVSFNINQGEFFSLLGPSGCGKTTLLRILAGFEHPTSGEIYLDGTALSNAPPNKRPTNMVFQNYAIFPHLSVRQNIAYGLSHKNLTKAQIESEVEVALVRIKMSGLGERRPNQLSGGQRQRVALARALVCRPKVLLLDEPLGALDKKLREEMQLELRHLQRSVGITFVFVTHDQEEALAMSDRIAVMSRGKVLQIDSSSVLYENPNSREVAEFIGSMNFFEGEVVSCNDGAVELAVPGVGVFRAVLGNRGKMHRGRATIAVRPEKMTLSSTDTKDGDENVVRGRLIAHSYLGDRNHFYVRVNDELKPIAVAAQNVSQLSGIALSDNREIWVKWNSEAGVVLNS